MSEISAVAVIDGSFGFIPIWSDMIFLLMNLQPVLLNIFSRGVEQTIPIVVNNTINVTV